MILLNLMSIAATDHSEQAFSEPMTESAVDDEIDRAIKHDKKVAGLRQCMNEDLTRLKYK